MYFTFFISGQSPENGRKMFFFLNGEAQSNHLRSMHYLFTWLFCFVLCSLYERFCDLIRGNNVLFLSRSLAFFFSF